LLVNQKKEDCFVNILDLYDPIGSLKLSDVISPESILGKLIINKPQCKASKTEVLSFIQALNILT